MCVCVCVCVGFVGFVAPQLINYLNPYQALLSLLVMDDDKANSALNQSDTEQSNHV